MRFRPLAVIIAKLGQLQRIPLATQDGPDDGHAGDSTDIADYFGQFDIHLLQRFLHVLDVLAAIAD